MKAWLAMRSATVALTTFALAISERWTIALAAAAAASNDAKPDVVAAAQVTSGVGSLGSLTVAAVAAIGDTGAGALVDIAVARTMGVRRVLLHVWAIR